MPKSLSGPAYGLRGVEGGEGVHRGVLLGVELLLGSAAEDVGVALVEAEADLTVDTLLGEVEGSCSKSEFVVDGPRSGENSRWRKARSGEKYMPLYRSSAGDEFSMISIKK